MESSALVTTENKSLKRNNIIAVPIVEKKPEEETKREATEVLNEEPNKKIIKFSESTNMDPLEYFLRFLDIPEIILQHLIAKDFITISEVNPNWFNFIASSKVFMKNIKIVLKRNSLLLPEDIDLLKNSSRLYQNIEVQRIFNSEEVFDEYYITASELEVFYEKSHNWKNVLLNGVHFRTADDLFNLLSSIESSVESLHIRSLRCDPKENNRSFRIEYLEASEALKFPKLKHLVLFNGDLSYFFNNYARLLQNSVAIEEIEIDADKEYENSEFFAQMLANFDKITSLTIKSNYLNKMFKDESWEAQFKLKSLNIIFDGYDELGINFHNFLKSQSDHLEKLSILVVNREKRIFDLVMDMPKLKFLCLHDFFNFSVDEMPDKASTTITELILNYDVDFVDFFFLLKSMPNVTKLTFGQIDNAVYKILLSLSVKFGEEWVDVSIKNVSLNKPGHPERMLRINKFPEVIRN